MATKGNVSLSKLEIQSVRPIWRCDRCCETATDGYIAIRKKEVRHIRQGLNPDKRKRWLTFHEACAPKDFKKRHVWFPITRVKTRNSIAELTVDLATGGAKVWLGETNWQHFLSLGFDRAERAALKAKTARIRAEQAARKAERQQVAA